LVNEHLRFHGVEVTYIPRKYVNRKTILEEVQTSKFDDNYSIEAYVNNFDGYSGAGDVLTKFGVSVRDELILTISKERFEEFIAAFLLSSDDDDIVKNRPREGDLVYFPLGERLFEIKYVEHEDPFYQLGKNYVYQLKCELFEYEDEVIDTSINVIDSQVQDEGFITTLNLIGTGSTATAGVVITGSVNSGYINKIYLNNDGSGYTSVPTIGISSSPTGTSSDNAEAVGILTTVGGVTSIKKIYLTNAGAGYTVAPTITISGGGGVGAAATASIVTTGLGVLKINVIDGGVGYSTAPVITIAEPPSSAISTGAVGIASIGKDNLGNDVVKSIYIDNPGRGYSSAPTITVAGPPISGIGTFIFNEIVEGSRSKLQGRVKEWDQDTAILKVANVAIGATTAPNFYPGETIVGKESGASWVAKSYVADDTYDKYTENDEFETLGDNLLDFTETNPFGTF